MGRPILRAASRLPEGGAARPFPPMTLPLDPPLNPKDTTTREPEGLIDVGTLTVPDPLQGAASLWPEPTRPGALDLAEFAVRPRPQPLLSMPARASGEGSAFDVCHVGVVLRAVLLVQVVVLLGVPYAAPTLDAAASVFAGASLASLWGTLVWLVAGCAGKRWLAMLPASGQWTAAIALGAASAAAGLWLLGFSGLAPQPQVPDWAPLASGGALAAAFFYSLRLRARARLPADAHARLAELQSRIRPHFLFNTLNTAVTLVRVDPSRAETVLEDLAALFRVALEEVGESVTLGDEIELARRYVEIEQLRFGPRLQVSWEIDPEGDRARVPPLLLQPLVENAVRHGIEPLPEGGRLRVRTRVRHGYVVIDILNPVGRRAAPAGHGMALRNVRERLRLMHDVAAQFEARRDGMRFHVRIVLPVHDLR